MHLQSAMVSYYNPLSPAMFPQPQMGVARHQPSSVSSAAASHAYFQHYNAAVAAYGHGHPHYPNYSPANLADLNSNTYNGSSSQNGTQFGTSGHDNWTMAATGQWPHFAANGPNTTTAPPTSSRFDLWQSNSEDSPPTPGGGNNENTGNTNQGGRHSPGNYGTTQSHSSGSPSGTPTPQNYGSNPEMFTSPKFSGFGPNNPPHSPNNAINSSQFDSSSPLNHMGNSEAVNPMVSPVASLASPSSRPQPARSPYEWMKKPSYQSQPEKSGRTRTKDKYRVVYSDHQRLELEKEFHYSRYITIRRKAELANSVGLSERQVKIWFQNRRAKERRAVKKHEEALVKEKMDPSTAAAAAAACAAAANFGVPFSENFHPPASSVSTSIAAVSGIDFPPPPPPSHYTHPVGTNPMKFE